MSLKPTSTQLAVSESACPYKGLDPYVEADQQFFFGRGADVRTIVSNLYASPLTVLCGASGVGKSSVLLAGVVPILREARQSPAVVFRTWQSSDCMEVLRDQTVDEIRRIAPEVTIAPEESFDKLLISASRLLDRPIYVIFDQFEEYFIYQPPSKESNCPDAIIARAVNRKTNNTNFLISMRDDGLAKLGRFQARIPDVLGNVMRLRHLETAVARDAITMPLKVYNELHPKDAPITIEAGLVDAVLDQTRPERVLLGETGQGMSPNVDATSEGVETPFLQMVMTRLWEVERSSGSNTLHLKTLEELGGAKAIVLSHLYDFMEGLPIEVRNIAAHAFTFLVTPSGSKIAYSAGDIARLTHVDQAKIQGLLDTLTRHDARILRTVSAGPERPNDRRYEIFHDVLAKAILSWSTRYHQEQQLNEERQETLHEKQQADEQRKIAQERLVIADERARYAVQQERIARKLKQSLAVVILLAIVAIASMVFAYVEHRRSRAREQELEDEAQRAQSALKDANERERSVLVSQLEAAQQAIDGLSKENANAKQLADDYERLANQRQAEFAKVRADAAKYQKKYDQLIQQRNMVRQDKK